MKVGIFFKVENGLLLDVVPLEAGEAYGDSIGYSGHYDFHENMRPRAPIERLFKSHDYDYYPRGRVVYFPKGNTFTLYTDPCLTTEEISQVKNLFDLKGQIVVVAEDEHYRCARCNRHYVE